MTSEDPIPLDQDPMQSWTGVAHSGGLCTLVSRYHVVLVNRSHDASVVLVNRSHDPSVVLMNRSHDPSVVLVNGSHDPSVVLVNRSHDPSVVLVNRSHDPSVVLVNRSHDPSVALLSPNKRLTTGTGMLVERHLLETKTRSNEKTTW